MRTLSKAYVVSPMNKQNQALSKIKPLFTEFEDIVSVKDVKIDIKKIAGVKTPSCNDVVYEVKPFSIFTL